MASLLRSSENPRPGAKPNKGEMGDSTEPFSTDKAAMSEVIFVKMCVIHGGAAHDNITA